MIGAVAFTARKRDHLLRSRLPEADRVAPLIGPHTRLPNAGVVDQHVDAAEPPERVRDDAVERFRVGQIGTDGMQRPTRLALARRLCHTGKSIRIAIHPGDLDAGGQQPERHGATKPARRSGHDRDLFIGCHSRVLRFSLLS